MVQIDYTTIGPSSAATPARWRTGSPRTSAGALRAGSPLPFPHESSLADPRGPPAWPAPARPTPAWPLCMARMRQRRADRDGGVVARPAPGLLFLFPTTFPLADPWAVADPPGRPAWPTRRAGANGTRENTLWFKAATRVTTDKSKAMYVADGNRRPSMRARTPAKLDSFARCRAPHHGPPSRRRSSFSEHEKRQAPSYPSSEAVCAFSARARPFSCSENEERRRDG